MKKPRQADTRYIKTGIAIVSLLSLMLRPAYAQIRFRSAATVTATTRQNLHFGSFTHGNLGGTITVSPNGTRSATGDIILLNSGAPCTPVVFELTARPGAVLSVVGGPGATLSGSKGGAIRLLTSSSRGGNSPIFTEISPGHTLVAIGGTLTVGNARSTPSGEFMGSFSVIVTQE